MLELLTDPSAWAALVTLTALEIVLGVDNVVFISVLVSRCSPRDAKRARQIGLSLAFVFRIILLLGLTWLMKLTYPLFTLIGRDFSWRDLILIAGGLFLIAKHPTTKMLALAFLVLIGMALVAEGFDFHIPRGYIYSAMAFAGAVEAVNIVVLRKRRRARKRNP